MPYDIPHTVSPSLWMLAWRRLRSDRVAMVSLAIVAAFLIMMLLSATGLIAKDWGVETRRQLCAALVSWRRPGTQSRRDPTPPPRPKVSDAPTPVDIEDPLADALAEIRAASGKGAAPSTVPKEPVWSIRLPTFWRKFARRVPRQPRSRRARQTLPFGGDKWGRDVLEENDQGFRNLDLRRPRCRDRRDLPRDRVRCGRRLLRKMDRRFLQLVLQRVHTPCRRCC